MNSLKTVILISACVVAIALSLTVRRIEQRQLQILEELDRIGQQLNSIPGANRATLDALKGEFLGHESAPLTMVEFIDLQCPFSRRFHTEAFDRIRQEYVGTGKLRYFTRQFPLHSINPLAIDAARAALCAGEQRQLWRMRHSILVNNAALYLTSFHAFARELQLDPVEFRACLDTPARVDKLWQADRTEGARIGISGTPTFLIGRTNAGPFEGIRLSGAKPFEVFAATLDHLLAETKSRASPERRPDH